MSTIFVCYSRRDRPWLDAIKGQLTTLAPFVATWDDSQIRTGHDWRAAIRRSIDRAAAAVVLMSDELLSSDFVMNEELPVLLERRAQNGLAVFVVLVSPLSTQHEQLERLRRFQWFNMDQPLSAQQPTRLPGLYQELVRELEAALEGGSSWGDAVERRGVRDDPGAGPALLGRSSLSKALLVHGPSGSGKSTWIEKLLRESFVPGDSSIRLPLAQVMAGSRHPAHRLRHAVYRQALRRRPDPIGEHDDPWEELDWAIEEVCEQLDGRLFLVLDDLDALLRPTAGGSEGQLDEFVAALHDWCDKRWEPWDRVHVVMASCYPRAFWSGWKPELRFSHFATKCGSVRIGELGSEDARSILRETAGVTVHDPQLARAIDLVGPNPGLLRQLALGVLDERQWRSRLDDAVRPGTPLHGELEVRFQKLLGSVRQRDLANWLRGRRADADPSLLRHLYACAFLPVDPDLGQPHPRLSPAARTFLERKLGGRWS